MCDRYINNQGTCFIDGNGNAKGNSNSNGNGNDSGKNMAKHDRRSIWYIDANNLYGYAMMQKLPYKDFQFTVTTTLDVILNTPDDSDHGYYIVCDIDYTNECKERTKPTLMPNKRNINDNELGYRERDGGKARSEKLIQD